MPLGNLNKPKPSALVELHKNIIGDKPTYPVATIVLSLLIANAVISSVCPVIEVSVCFLSMFFVSPPPKYYYVLLAGS